MKKFFAILCMVMLMLNLAACGSTGIVGTWVAHDGDLTHTITFDKNGNLTMTEESGNEPQNAYGTYNYANNTLVWNINGRTNTLSVELDKDTLIIIGPDDTICFTRK